AGSRGLAAEVQDHRPTPQPSLALGDHDRHRGAGGTFDQVPPSVREAVWRQIHHRHELRGVPAQLAASMLPGPGAGTGYRAWCHGEMVRKKRCRFPGYRAECLTKTTIAVPACASLQM